MSALARLGAWLFGTVLIVRHLLGLVRRRRRAPDPLVALGVVASMLGSLAFMVVYVLGAQTQLAGISLAVALGGLGCALVAWAKRDMPHELVEEPWEPLHPTSEERAALTRELQRMPRRLFIERMFAGAGAALGLALAFPLASLGPRPGGRRQRSAWQAGARLVPAQAGPLRSDALNVGEMLTVFPEGHAGRTDSQVVLVRVEPDTLRPPPDRADWSPQGYVAYSKLCTHAGCPVGLYQPESQRLFCPCHQSEFDVLDGARPLSGPAARPLPQLPLQVDDDGFLVARGDFSAPVGPGFWRRA